MGTGCPGDQFGELVLVGDDAADVAAVVLPHALDEAVSGQGSASRRSGNSPSSRVRAGASSQGRLLLM